MKEFLIKVILPLAGISLLLLLFVPLCKANGKMDYFLLWVLVGCPFGLQKMFVWLIPKGHGLSGTVGVVALNLIVGGIIGGFIAAYRIIYAVFYTLK